MANLKFNNLMLKHRLVVKKKSPRHKILKKLGRQAIRKKKVLKWKARSQMYGKDGKYPHHDIDCLPSCQISAAEHMWRRYCRNRLIASPEHYANCKPWCTISPGLHALLYWRSCNYWRDLLGVTPKTSKHLLSPRTPITPCLQTPSITVPKPIYFIDGQIQVPRQCKKKLSF
jgi:hypothetical protein